MKNSNYKKVSSHGSINIPVTMRREMGIQGGDPMEVSLNDGVVMVKPYMPRCIFCGVNDEGVIHKFRGKFICSDCAAESYGKVKKGKFNE